MTQPPFELPAATPPEDALVLEHMLTALQSLGNGALALRYRVSVVKGKGYLLHAALPTHDPFELTQDDSHYLNSIHPARLESVGFARTVPGGPCELVLLVLNSAQRVMVTASVAFSATRKRRFTPVAQLLAEAARAAPAAPAPPAAPRAPV